MKSIGMIGCGGIARLHAACMKEIGGLYLKKVFDIDPHAAQLFAVETGAARCKAVEEIFCDEAIDAVYICTRHDTHAALIEAGLRAGKDVFCEKPMAMNVQECEKIKKAMDESGRKLMVGYNMRFAPMTVAFKQLMRQKNFQPDICQATMATAPFLESWAGLPKQGGGALVCLGSHIFDLLRFLLEDEFAEILCVEKRIHLQAPYLENYVNIWARLEKSTMVEISLHDQAAESYSFSPAGKVVSLQMHGLGVTAELCPYAGYGFYGKKKADQGRAPDGQVKAWGYMEENKIFLQVVEGAAPLYPGFSDGLADVEIIETAQEAAASKQWQRKRAMR